MLSAVDAKSHTKMGSLSQQHWLGSSVNEVTEESEEEGDTNDDEETGNDETMAEPSQQYFKERKSPYEYFQVVIKLRSLADRLAANPDFTPSQVQRVREGAKTIAHSIYHLEMKFCDSKEEELFPGINAAAEAISDVGRWPSGGETI